MRQFEIDDAAAAADGDSNAKLRVERRQDAIAWYHERRKGAMALASPVWRDKKSIQGIYQKARKLTAETGVKHEVDHIVPIQGEKVCGLHVEANLQILKKTANVRKHANFSDVDHSAQLENAGLKIIAGLRKIKAALKVGRPVVVMDCHRSIYRVISLHGQIVVAAIGESDTPPEAIVSFMDPN